MTLHDTPPTALRTNRLVAAPPRAVYEAFERPELLTQWWGPTGFTNTFARFEFRPGGTWDFVMHGPDGRDYANTCVFRELGPARLVIDHTVAPLFLLTVTLTEEADGTRIDWLQDFLRPEVTAAVRAVVVPSNEQVLDRLARLLAGRPVDAP